jgi:hypothetical protein
MKRVSLEAAHHYRLFERLRDKPFWLWNTREHKQEDDIVTGPNQDITIKLIKRMKSLFELHNIGFANKEMVLELKLDNPKFVFIDEAASLMYFNHIRCGMYLHMASFSQILLILTCYLYSVSHVWIKKMLYMSGRRSLTVSFMYFFCASI